MNLFPIIWLGATVVAAILLIVFRPERNLTWLVLIASLVAFAVWCALPGSAFPSGQHPGIRYDFNNDGTYEINKPLDFRRGLDLAGGVKVLLQADLPEGTTE